VATPDDLQYASPNAGQAQTPTAAHGFCVFKGIGHALGMIVLAVFERAV
jgi:hypothetical protein